jgi:hypothetical protein
MKIIEADNRIILDATGSYIENKKTGDQIQIRHENGCFVFDMWVPAKKDDKKNATGARRANGHATRATGSRSELKNQYQPLAEDNMEVGDVECEAVFDDRRTAVFTRQEC